MPMASEIGPSATTVPLGSIRAACNKPCRSERTCTVGLASVIMTRLFIFDPPYVWLPTVLVLAAWAGHLLVFRKLREETGR